MAHAYVYYAANFEVDLSFSIPVPVLCIPPENVFHMTDEVAPLDDPDKKPPAKCIYSDGCGWMNEQCHA
ncbi:hypothetical protein LXA43DRAFT_101069 [Ganoderma leucocontextum]|nr:hypothetical protein LXA43DRAFT_192604 [Ganoderma leucocontextum]KAI1785810.1 hypothetical protein LXA43DRAFT_101069 [Ganoderma leucocontextum]